MILNSPFISGSLTVTGNTIISGSITAPAGIAGTASYASNAELLDGLDSTSFTTTSSFNAASSSFSTRVANTEATASQYVDASASFSTRTTTVESYTSNINAKTGSYATTGSNFFIGTQVVTGSVFISSDLVVQGSSSLQNITASAVSVGTNTIILNTATPILPFGGISVQDSGSTMGRSGSLLWNSINDHWINVNPSGSDEGYNSAMIINGPKNTGSLGQEAGLTTNYIPVSQGEDHITDSIIFQSGSTNIGIGTDVPSYKLDVSGTGRFTGALTGSTATFASSVTATSFEVGNGQFYKARRTSSDLLTDMIGIPSGTNDVRILTTGDFNVINGSLTNLLAVKNNGNVGIGPTSPSTKLHVASSISSSLVNAVPALGFANSSSVALFTNGDTAYGTLFGTLNTGVGWIQQQRADGTGTAYNLLLQPNGGNVGIGTTSPNKNLHIKSSNGNATSQLQLESTGTVKGYMGVFSDTIYINSGGTYNSGWSLDGAFGIASVELNSFNGGSTVLFSTAASNTTPSERMRITSGGNVGIGTTAPSNLLEVQGNIKFNASPNGTTKLVFGVSGTNYASLRYNDADGSLTTQTLGNYPLIFGTNITERMRITSGGLFKFQNSGSSYESSSGGVNEFNTNADDTNVVFRNTATSLTSARAGIDVFYRNATPNNTSAAFYQAADFSGGSRTLRFEVRSNGGIGNYQANNVNLSDERTKKDIIPLESYWNKFKALEIVKFKYKDQTHEDFNIGVIAQQVESVASEFVDVDGWGETPEDGVPLKSIYTADLYHATIGVLQEAMAKIEELSAKVAALEAQQ